MEERHIKERFKINPSLSALLPFCPVVERAHTWCTCNACFSTSTSSIGPCHFYLLNLALPSRSLPFQLTKHGSCCAAFAVITGCGNGPPFELLLTGVLINVVCAFQTNTPRNRGYTVLSLFIFNCVFLDFKGHFWGFSIKNNPSYRIF